MKLIDKICLLTFFVAIFISCKKEDENITKRSATQTTENNNSDSEDDLNKIEITNVTPKAELTVGNNIEFEVTVNYSLVTYQKGEINIGFNDGTALASSMQKNESIPITKGKGEQTFMVKAKVRDWGTKGDFLIYVNIEQKDTENDSNVYYPIATNTYILIPKD